MGGAGVTGIAGLVGGLSGPAAPIVVPIALGVAVGHWLYTVYQQTPGILRVLMGYIIDLTAILEGLFVLLRAQSIPDEGALPRPLTIGLINLTIEEYQESETKPQCHKLIKKFVGSRPNIFQVDYRDQVLQEVINLIENHRFVPSDECKQNAKALFERAGRPVSRNNEAV
ncbi:hypothetical protein FRB96_007074 [Tulasnella sp. 330]|nr:hypothetical protein FRB96_007074 [Tulasnella sp. 330]